MSHEEMRQGVDSRGIWQGRVKLLRESYLTSISLINISSPGLFQSSDSNAQQSCLS